MLWSTLTSRRIRLPYAREIFRGSKILMSSIGGPPEGPRQRRRLLLRVAQLEAVQTVSGLGPAAKAMVGHGTHQFQLQENEGTTTVSRRATRLAVPRRDAPPGRTTEGHLQITKVARRIRRRDARDRMRTRTFRATMATGATTVAQTTEILHRQGGMIGVQETIAEALTDTGIATMTTRTETGKRKTATVRETEEHVVVAVARGGTITSAITEFENVSTRTIGDDYTKSDGRLFPNASE